MLDVIALGMELKALFARLVDEEDAAKVGAGVTAAAAALDAGDEGFPRQLERRWVFRVVDAADDDRPIRVARVSTVTVSVWKTWAR